MAWHVQRPRGLERGGEPRELGELQRVLGAAEVTGAQPPQSSCWMTVAPPPGPLPPPGLSILCVCAPTVQRPVIHPLSSPSNRFCVTSLDPDTLPTVATLLMDVMFYSNG